MHELQKYRFSQSIDHSFKVAELFNEDYLKTFMKTLTDSIGAPNEKVASSIFMKRYAFLAVISLYAMTALNKKVNVSLENVIMESAVQGREWLPKFSFNDLTLEDWNGEHRNDWRISILQDLFAKNISPLINQLEKTFKISRLILWENIAIYIFWLYETELKEDADFRFLLFEAEWELFGAFKQNPLQKYFSKRNPDEVRIRKTCCFSYQLTSGKRCKTCPCSRNIKDGRCQNGEGFCSTI